ncbi:MAG TPA: PEGA domain-containing protein [Polyangiaceae bacterium]
MREKPDFAVGLVAGSAQRRLFALAVLAMLIARALPLRAQPAPTEEDRRRALELFRVGNTQFRDGAFIEARQTYLEAWTLAPTFDIACNLGRTEVELGLKRDAAEHLSFCLENFAASSRPEFRDAEDKFRILMDRVRPDVAGLHIVVEPAGAEVLVDATIVGHAPLRRDIFVEPGERLVRARLQGYASVERSVVAHQGRTRELRLDLVESSAPEARRSAVMPGATEPLAQSPDPGPAGVDTPPPRASHWPAEKWAAVIAGSALTAAGIGVGIGFSLRAGSLDDDVTRLREQSEREEGQGACYIGDSKMQLSQTCNELLEREDSYDTARNVALVGFIGGGVFAVSTSAVWLLWPDESPDAARAPRPLVGVSRAGTFFGVAAQF